MAADLQLEERLRRDLTANVAHELRTPLSVLQAETTALADGVVEWSPQLARSFEEEVARLSRLVEDLGTLAAAESASLNIEWLPVRLDHLAAESAERLRHRLEGRRVSLELHLSPVTIIGDADRIEQIVANLLGNAARYVMEGGVVQVVVEDNNQPKLVVSDNGPGIPEAERAKIFDRFARGSTAVGVVGSGIGLAVVQELAAAHGATVQLRPSAQGGSEFTVTFPAAESRRDPSGLFSTRSTHRFDRALTPTVSDGHMTCPTPQLTFSPVTSGAGTDSGKEVTPMAKTHPASFSRDRDHDRDTEKSDKNDDSRDDSRDN
jgi:signal transduction histidine kinase